MNQIEIGKFIADCRKKKKITQEQIAKYLNMTQSTYQHYENERAEPNIDTLCKLADYYNVTLDYLVGREFTNDIGYLNEQQKNAVKMIQQLNENNLALAIAYMGGMIVNQ